MVQMIELQLTPLIDALSFIYRDVMTLIGLALVLFISGGLSPFVFWYAFKRVEE